MSDSFTAGPLSKVLSNKNYRASAILLLLCLLWLGSGIFAAEEGAESQISESERETKVLVKARYIDALEYRPLISVRARTEANRSLELSAEISGKVIALPIAEGSLVEAGDVICELGLEDRQLLVQQAESALAQANLDYEGALRLKRNGYQSESAIANAKLQLDSARASLERSRLNLAHTKIRAPFDGVLDRYSVEVGEYMKVGNPCAMLMDLEPLVARGQVSETELSQLHAGMAANVRLLTGEAATGTIIRVGYAPDPVTRGFEFEVQLPNPNIAMRPGITTRVEVEIAPVKAHLVEPSLLSLDDQGSLGIKVLDKDHRVEFVNVELVGDQGDRLWILGLPEHALLVTVGQEYISGGELVDVVIEGEGTGGGDAGKVLATPEPADHDLQSERAVDEQGAAPELSAVKP